MSPHIIDGEGRAHFAAVDGTEIMLDTRGWTFGTLRSDVLRDCRAWGVVPADIDAVVRALMIEDTGAVQAWEMRA
jgi:hypothetical protein